MPPPEFFLPFGFFVERSFLSEESIIALITTIEGSDAEPATVGDQTYRLDETVRKTGYARVPQSSLVEVRAALQRLMPRVAHHFQVQLSGFEDPKCLVYAEGDFFREHDDELSGYGLPPRQVSIVIFLNAPPDFEGGKLTFYGLVDDPKWRNLGFDVAGEAGVLIAFRPELRHEVTAVNAGRRFTVVTWYY